MEAPVRVTELPPSPSTPSTVTEQPQDGAKAISKSSGVAAVPAGLYAPGDKENTKGVVSAAGMSARGGTRDFGFLPIPKRLQWDPASPPIFGWQLNAIFGFAATFCK